MLEFSMYSIGSGRFLREVFNAVAMLTGTGDFIKAVAIAMLFQSSSSAFRQFYEAEEVSHGSTSF